MTRIVLIASLALACACSFHARGKDDYQRAVRDVLDTRADQVERCYRSELAESDKATGKDEIVAVARLSKIPGTNEAEFAVLVSDLWQHRGLGTGLLSMLVQVARDEKMSCLRADILPENTEMQRVAEKLGFTLKRDLEEGTVEAALRL